jgi:hypothetical protein
LHFKNYSIWLCPDRIAKIMIFIFLRQLSVRTSISSVLLQEVSGSKLLTAEEKGLLKITEVNFEKITSVSIQQTPDCFEYLNLLYNICFHCVQLLSNIHIEL